MDNFWLLTGKSAVLILSYAWGYWQLFRGTGCVIGVAVGLVCLITVLLIPDLWLVLAFLFLTIGIFAFFRSLRKRKKFEPPRMVFEGGGIRRGLDPVEIGHFWGRSRTELVGLAVLELVNEGLLQIVDRSVRIPDIFQGSEAILNPSARRASRKAQARQGGVELTDLEDILLEIILQKGDSAFSSVDFRVWEERLAEQAHFRLGGFDAVQTLEYYRDYLAHRVAGVEKGHFPVESFLSWLWLAVLEDQALETFAAARKLLSEFDPAWLPAGAGLVEWLEDFQANLTE